MVVFNQEDLNRSCALWFAHPKGHLPDKSNYFAKLLPAWSNLFCNHTYGSGSKLLLEEESEPHSNI